MKYLRYMKYLFKHKYNVLKESIKLGILWRGITHDLSKFRPDEFFPYTERFYGQGNNKDFDLALQKHYHRNDHHWQYWVKIGGMYNMEVGVIEMNYDAIKEMLCDWYAMAQHYEGTGWLGALVWFKNHKDEILLHPTTERLVSAWLRYLAAGGPKKDIRNFRR